MIKSNDIYAEYENQSLRLWKSLRLWFLGMNRIYFRISFLKHPTLQALCLPENCENSVLIRQIDEIEEKNAGYRQQQKDDNQCDMPFFEINVVLYTGENFIGNRNHKGKEQNEHKGLQREKSEIFDDPWDHVDDGQGFSHQKRHADRRQYKIGDQNNKKSG